MQASEGGYLIISRQREPVGRMTRRETSGRRTVPENPRYDKLGQGAPVRPLFGEPSTRLCRLGWVSGLHEAEGSEGGVFRALVHVEQDARSVGMCGWL